MALLVRVSDLHLLCVLSVQVEEGEMMFYPAGYWHQPENLDVENIAVCGSVLDANCASLVKHEFQQECRSRKQRFAFTPEVCSALETKCYPWWDTAFRGAFKHDSTRSTQKTRYNRGSSAR